MKKLTLSIVCALAMTGVAFAGGTVNWDFITPAAMTAQTNSTQFSSLFGGGVSGGGSVGNTASATSGVTFHYELLYNTSFTGSQVASPNFATLFGGTWLDTGLSATNSIIDGRLTTVNPTTAAVIPWDNGTTNNIIMVGWSANLGTSWLAASNNLANWYTGDVGYVPGEAYFGESATGYITPNPSLTNPGAIVFGSGPNISGLPIFSPNTQLYIMPIPEPGTIALAGLGGLCLLLFRRCK